MEQEKALSKKAEEIKFLSDLPLDADREQEMRFGHLSIVENLKDTVLKSPTPFTIGLFGKWGSGKTTILDALARKLSDTQVAVVRIDAWKHEGDALRRTILQDTVGQLQKRKGRKQYLSNKFKLSENLRVLISRTIQSVVKLDRPLVWRLIGGSAIAVGLGFLIRIVAPQNLGTYISIMTGGGLIAGILVWLLQKSVVTESVTTTVDRFRDPQEFEDEFKRIVGETSAERLLMIIDNLDRVSCERAVALLSTIKTFLEQERCTFLIACDADAIKNHLEKLYLKDPNDVSRFSLDGNEFLRKFFNCCLTIPEFIDTELQSYTEHLLRETNLSIEDMPDVAYVISTAFRDNPRQIKQFINTFLTHFLLAKVRETIGELPESSVTGNAAYLAKYLIVRQLLSSQHGSLESEKADNVTDSKLRDFLRATQPINVEDERPFRYLKLSQEEIEMPEIIELQFAMQDRKVEQVERIIGTFKDAQPKLDKLRKFASSYIRRNRGKNLLLYNTVSSILSAMQELGIVLDKYFYCQIADLFGEEGELGAELQNFQPGLVFEEILSRCERNQRKVIIHRYTGLLNDPKVINPRIQDRETYIRNLLQQLIVHKPWLGPDGKQEVRIALAQHYHNYETLSLFIGKISEQKDLIIEDTISNFIGKLTELEIEQIDNVKNAFYILFDFKEILTDKNLAECTTQLTSLLANENAQPFSKHKQNFMACLLDLINTYSQRLTKLTNEILEPFGQAILNGMNALGLWEEKRIFVPVCIWIANVMNEPIASQTRSALDGFFASASHEDLGLVLKSLMTKSEKEALISSYGGTLKQRAISDQGFFNFLYPVASKDAKTDWLISLIQSDHNRAVTTIEQLHYKIGDKKTLISEILVKAEQIPIPEREALYRVCNKLKCANDAQLKEKLSSNIKMYLKNTNPDYQTLGLAVLREASHLSQTQRREISREVIDWLSTLEPSSAFQPSSVNSVLLSWDILPRALKERFLDFIFEKLIRRGDTADSIDLGFNTLLRIDPKPCYEDFTTYFDDVLSRTETESDPNIRSRLSDGLRSLQPQELNSNNRDFWERVRRLPKE